MAKYPRLLTRAAWLLCTLALVAACDQLEQSFANESQSQVDTSRLVKTLRKQSNEALDAAYVLQAAAQHFHTTTNADSLERLRTAWQAAHQAYAAAEPVLLLSDEHARTLQFNIDAWPITPGFIDQIPGYENSGIVADVTVPITAESIRAQHGITSPEEVCLGFHAIEFLIAHDTDVFIQGEDATEQSAQKTARRVELLNLMVNLLIEDMEALGTYAQTLSTEGPTGNALLKGFLASEAHRFNRTIAASQLAALNKPGHGLTKSASYGTLATQLNMLQSTLADDERLMAFLENQESEVVKNFLATLPMTTNLLTLQDEEERAVLPLALTALAGQLDSLQKSVP